MICPEHFVNMVLSQNETIYSKQSRKTKDENVIALCTVIKAKKEYEKAIMQLAFNYSGFQLADLSPDIISQLVAEREKLKARFGASSYLYRLIADPVDSIFVLGELTNLVAQSSQRVLACMNKINAMYYPNPREDPSFSLKLGDDEILCFLNYVSFPPNDAEKYLQNKYITAFNMHSQMQLLKKIFPAEFFEGIRECINYLATYLKAKDSRKWSTTIILTEASIFEKIAECAPDIFLVGHLQ